MRDALLGRSTRDLDFVVAPAGLRAVEEWAASLDVRCVPFDHPLPTRRIVFEDGATWDFAALRAATLEEDLRLRDFTINAIAVRIDSILGEALLRWIDPCGGRNDLQDRRLLWASPRSLPDDPLRMLRAYRFMATLRFRLAESTREEIVANVDRIREPSPERIREEFFRLLSAKRAYPALHAMDDVRLLSAIFPEVEGMRGAPQNAYHHLDVWAHTLAAIDLFEHEPIPPSILDKRDFVTSYLEESIGQEISNAALIKFALLFHDVAKPETRTVGADGRIRFIGHEKRGAEIIAEIGKRLRLSNRVRERAECLVASHLLTMHLSARREGSERALRRFLRRTGPAWLGVLLLSWADIRASCGPARTEAQRRRSAETIRAIVELHKREKATRRPRLLTGNDLIERFGVPEGPQIGRLLRAVEAAQLSGEIATREEALRFVRRWLEMSRER